MKSHGFNMKMRLIFVTEKLDKNYTILTFFKPKQNLVSSLSTAINSSESFTTKC